MPYLETVSKMRYRQDKIHIVKTPKLTLFLFPEELKLKLERLLFSSHLYQ